MIRAELYSKVIIKPVIYKAVLVAMMTMSSRRQFPTFEVKCVNPTQNM